MENMIIGIAGPTASGKTTVARMLEEKYGAVRLRYSSILSEIAKERGLDPDDKATLQNLFLSERVSRGEDWLTKEMIKRAQAVINPMVVIEGNRRLVDVGTLRAISVSRKVPLHLIYIDASIDTRYARHNHRLKEHGEPEIDRAAFESLETNGAEDELLALRDIFKEEGLYISTDELNPEKVFQLVTNHID